MALGLSHAFAVPKRRRRLAEGKLQRLPRRRRRRRLHGNKYRQTAMDQRGAASRGGRGGASGRGSSTACSASSRHLIGLMGCAVTHRLYRVVKQSPPSWTGRCGGDGRGKGGCERTGRGGGE